MSTGIFRRNPIGELEEVKQEHIDYWCNQCQFPYGAERCQDKNLIQRCWNEHQAIAETLNVESEAHIWHLQHECPFIHQGTQCRCNEFKTIEEAFQAAHIRYKRR
jgi:hypothetical protein